MPEVRNRATIAGAIEIGRHPGVVQVTFRAPAERLEARGLLGYAREQYAERLARARAAPHTAKRTHPPVPPAEGRTIS